MKVTVDDKYRVQSFIQFAESNHLELCFWRSEQGRWGAHFRYAEGKRSHSDGVLCSVTGHGKSPREALVSLMEDLKQFKVLVISAMDKRQRREIDIPTIQPLTDAEFKAVIEAAQGALK